MKKKTKDGIMKYALRGFVAAIAGLFMIAPLSIVMILASGILGLIVIPLYFVYLAVVIIISGWIMTKTVKEWVK